MQSTLLRSKARVLGAKARVLWTKHEMRALEIFVLWISPKAKGRITRCFGPKERAFALKHAPLVQSKARVLYKHAFVLLTDPPGRAPDLY